VLCTAGAAAAAVGRPSAGDRSALHLGPGPAWRRRLAAACRRGPPRGERVIMRMGVLPSAHCAWAHGQLDAAIAGTTAAPRPGRVTSARVARDVLVEEVGLPVPRSSMSSRLAPKPPTLQRLEVLASIWLTARWSSRSDAAPRSDRSPRQRCPDLVTSLRPGGAAGGWASRRQDASRGGTLHADSSGQSEVVDEGAVSSILLPASTLATRSSRVGGRE